VPLRTLCIWVRCFLSSAFPFLPFLRLQLRRVAAEACSSPDFTWLDELPLRGAVTTHCRRRSRSEQASA
jgi:hypothetical protein